MAYLEEMTDWLKTRINAEIARHNETESGVQLETISDAEVGFRDVLVGLRSYPALCVAETSRNCGDAYLTKSRVNLCVALRLDDEGELNRQGEIMTDITEKAIRTDPKFGGLLLDSSELVLEKSQVSGVYIIAGAMLVTYENENFGM